MKKAFFGVTLALLYSVQIQAQVFYETFALGQNQPLSSAGWSIHSGGETNEIKTVPGLSFGALQSIGSAVQLSSSGQDVHQRFTEIDRETVYLSAWVNVSSASEEGGYFLHLGPNELGSTFRARVFVKENSQGDLQFGISKSSNDPVYTTESFKKNTTHLIIIKYSFFEISNTDDIVEINVFETGKDIGTESYISQSANGESDAPSIGSVALRQGSRNTAPSLVIDEIKVSKTWETATKLSLDPFIKIETPENLISYSDNCINQPIYKVSLSALGQSQNLNLWTADPDGLHFSSNGEEWVSQLSFFSENGSYANDFFIQPKNTFNGGETGINIDDEEVNVVGVFELSFEKKNVRDDCSLPIADFKSLSVGFTGRINGTVTASDQEFGNFNYIQDESGGIRVNSSYGWSIGDSVSISGKLGEVFDDIALLEKDCCGPASGVRTIGKGNVKPKVVQVGELENYMGQLVTVEGVTLSDPNFVFFPNSNENIRQGNRAGQLRIWSSTELDGFGKNANPQDFTGVVGRFGDNIQIYPRVASDAPGLKPFEFPQLVTPAEESFDVAAWNLEWFGSEGNGPIDDDLQLANASKVLKNLDADAVVLTEISNLTYFNNLVGNLQGYDGTCSNAVSNGATGGNAQRVCLLYKTETVTLSSTRPLLGNTTFINDYPGGFDRFWASGRLPALFVCDVDLNGISRRLHIIGIHARANRNNNEERELVYNMRKKDLEVLKDTLDTQFSAASVIMMGDFNDDLDESVVSGIEASTYEPFVKDIQNWNMVSKTLSDKGYKSYIGFDNVIDHIGFSDELNGSYMSNSVFLDLPFTYLDNYTNTTSDHLPIVARFNLEQTVTSTELLQVDSILIYPNPTTGNLFIKGAEDVKMVGIISDQKGAILGKFEGEKNKIEKKVSRILSKSSSGLYLLQLNIGNHSKSYKIVKQD